MANNFKDITNNGQFTILRYFSKAGHDSNDGLTPDTPQKSITLAPAGNTLNLSQVGAGVYDLQNTGLVSGGALIGDGKVLIKNGRFFNKNFYARKIDFFNLTVEGSNSGLSESVVLYDGKINNYTSIVKTSVVMERMIVKDAIGVVTNYHTFESCILVNVEMQGVPIFAGTRSTGIAKLVNCYISRDCTIHNQAFIEEVGGSPYFPLIDHCNYRGIMTHDGSWYSDGIGRSYAIQDLYVGTPQDNGYPAGVEWLSYEALVANGWLGWLREDYLRAAIASNINRDPLFSNESIEDYTLQAGSPHIAGGNDDIRNIGGTLLAISVSNQDGNTDTEIIPSSTINTSDPTSYRIETGEIDGYIDYIKKVGSSNLVLEQIDPISELNFDSDFDGATPQNKNVPDSEPLTIDYPRITVTTSASTILNVLNVTGNDAVVGEFVRIAGEDREVTARDANTITLSADLRALPATGTAFQIAAEYNIAALKPNRLTYQLRTSKSQTKPTVDSDWDNNIDPVYGMAGAFLTQEWYTQPKYVINTLNGNAVYGIGDSEAPQGLQGNEISCKWVQIRVYLRNNYDS